MSILGLARDAHVSALGRLQDGRRSAPMLQGRCDRADARYHRHKFRQRLRIIALIANRDGIRRQTQLKDEIESGPCVGTNDATLRQQSRRRAMNCVPAMARLGPRAAAQRESASDCGGDCGGTAYDPRADARRESLLVASVCNQGSRFRSRSSFLKQFQTDRPDRDRTS